MQAMGGHGYSTASGQPWMMEHVTPNVIWEGENTILLLQVAVMLLKTFRNVTAGKNKSIIETMEFFKDHENLSEWIAPKEKADYRKIETYKNIFKKMIVEYIKKAGLKLMELTMEKGIDRRDALDKHNGITIIAAAKLYTTLFTIEFFDRKIKSLKEGEVKKAFENLNLLLAVDELKIWTAVAFETESIGYEGLEWVGVIFEELLDDIHPEAMTLVRGYGFPEEYVFFKAPLFKKEGEYEQALLDWARNCGELNKFDVHPIMLEYIKAQKKEAENRKSIKPKL